MAKAKYSPELTNEICKYLRAGNTQKDSARLAGIAEDTYYTWKKEHTEFAESMEKAELECKARNIAIIQQAAEHTWQAAAWWLERKHNMEFALKQLNEITGKDGNPIQLTYKIDMAGGYLPPMGLTFTPSTGSNTGLTPVQSSSVASPGTEDNNSTNGDNETGTV